jgi:hypothetical protein
MRAPFHRFATTVMLLLVLAGCASSGIDQLMNSWVGSHKSKLILSWGPPARYDSDGLDGEVLTWEFRRDGYVATRSFWVHADGTIYAWRWHGD